MQSTSTTLEPAALIAASLHSSAPVARDGQARGNLTDGDDLDAELALGRFRRLGLGFRRMLDRIKASLAGAFSRHSGSESGDGLRGAIAEGRRQVAAERKAARQAAREARALVAREERAVRAWRRGSETRQADEFEADTLSTGRPAIFDDAGLQIGVVSDGGMRTIQGIGPFFVPQAAPTHRPKN